jgi:outer membrane receptor protein involved in Fe transport
MLIPIAFPASLPLLAAEEPLDVISVTAKRRAAAASEVSSSVSLVDGELIERGKLVTDALNAVPGVFLQQTTPGQGAAIVRGLKGSAVLHLVDGLLLNNAIFRSAPTQYLALVPLAAVERLEVVRGTPTSLHGSDAVGGVVQVVTHVPEFPDATTGARGEFFAGFDSAELGKRVHTTLDVGNERFATSLSAEVQRTGNRRVGGGERIGPSGFESRAARLVLRAAPSPGQSWLLDLHWLEQPETPRVDELVPGFGQSAPASSEFLFAPNRRTFVHAGYEDEAGPLGLEWTADLAWQRIVDDRVTRDYGAAERRLEDNRSDLFGATVSAAGETGSVSWIAGGEIYHDEVRSSRFEETVATGERVMIAARFPDGSSMRQAALYGNADLRTGNRHVVSAGLRFSFVEVRLAGTAPTTRSTTDVNDLSGDLGWVFDWTDSTQIVANAGFGFRAPNVFDLGTLGARPGNRFNVPNTDLDSEDVVHLDLGLRRRSDRWRWEIDVYALDYEDRITSVGTGDVTEEGRDVVQSVNAASALIRGVEAGVEFSPRSSLTVAGAISYSHGRQRVEGSRSEPADRIPPLNGWLRAAWGNGGPWRFTGRIEFARRQDRLSARDVDDVRIDPGGTAGWAVASLGAEREIGAAWRLGMDIGNLLDERYRRHGSGLDAPGRSFSLTLRGNWGY